MQPSDFRFMSEDEHRSGTCAAAPLGDGGIRPSASGDGSVCAASRAASSKPRSTVTGGAPDMDDLFPLPNTQGRPTRARVLLEQAETAFALGDLENGASAIEAAIAEDPHDEEIPLIGAALRHRQADIEPAAALALASLRIRPCNPKAWNLLAVICLDAGRPDLSVILLERATAVAPKLVVARKNLKEVRSRLGRNRRNQEQKPATGVVWKDVERHLDLKETSLTACILARDADAGRLDDCLESLRGLATEILIVDARRAQAASLAVSSERIRLIDACGCEDAASARNLGVQRATSHWILSMNAGERIEPGGGPSVSRALLDPKQLFHALVVRKGRTDPGRWEVRLFRNAPGVGFVGRVHEQARHSLKPLQLAWGSPGGEVEATIATEAGVPARTEADAVAELQALERDLAEDPGNLQAWTRRIRAETRRGNLQLVLDRLAELRKALWASPLFLGELDLEEPTVLEAYCQLKLGRFDKALETIRDYHSGCRPTSSTLYLEGAAEQGLKRPKKAATLLRRSISALGEPSYSEPLAEATGTPARILLGAALLDGGSYEAARAAFDEALEMEPGCVDARVGLLALRHAEGRVREVLQELDALVAVSGNDPKVWLAGSILLDRIPRMEDAALSWIEEGQRRFAENPEMRRRLACAQLRCGRARAALETWKGLETRDLGTVAGCCAAALASGQEIPEIPGSMREEARSEVLVWFRRWLASGTHEALDRSLVGLRRAEPALPGLLQMTAEWLDAEGQVEAADRIRADLPHR